MLHDLIMAAGIHGVVNTYLANTVLSIKPSGAVITDDMLHPVTNIGVQYSTKKLNGVDPSMLFTNSGTNDWTTLSIPDSPDFALGTQDFTMEFYMNCTSGSTVQILMMQWNNGIAGSNSWAFEIDVTELNFYISTTGTGWTHKFKIGNFVPNQNYRVAVSRQGNNLHMFMDNVKTTYTLPINFNFINSPEPITIGGYLPTHQYNYGGYLSNIEIVRGVAKYV